MFSLLLLLVSMTAAVGAKFSPRSSTELRNAVLECLKHSPSGEHCKKGPIGSWNVSQITNMDQMFQGAASFNQDLSSWDVSKVTSMAKMFNGAIAFNQDLSSWDVSKVMNMHSTFHDAYIFNQDLSSWDVSKVTNMDAMFYFAVAFEQDLCGSDWVDSKAPKNGIFTGSRGSICTVAATPPPRPPTTSATTTAITKPTTITRIKATTTTRTRIKATTTTTAADPVVNRNDKDDSSNDLDLLKWIAIIVSVILGCLVIAVGITATFVCRKSTEKNPAKVAPDVLIKNSGETCTRDTHAQNLHDLGEALHPTGFCG